MTPILTPEERRLAAEPGRLPQQRSAREKVVRYFYQGRSGLGDNRCEQDLKSIDLDQPVEVVRFPPPPAMYQYVRVRGKPGNWFDPEGDQPPNRIGISSIGREPVAFNTPEGEGLLSTAAPIEDGWTDPGTPVYTQGGGRQIVVDDSTRDRFQRLSDEAVFEIEGPEG